MDGVIKVNKLMDMDDLPTPDYSVYPIKSYKYKPILNKSPFLTIQSSRGCPYSCGHYCTYPTSQGNKVRYRDISLIIEDINYMNIYLSLMSLIHILRCRRIEMCRYRLSPYH